MSNKVNAAGLESKNGHCPKCRGNEISHVRTDGSANARCNKCNVFFSDLSYGKVKNEDKKHKTFKEWLNEKN